MDSRERALARSYTYRLFARLYREGVTEATGHVVQELPWPAEARPPEVDPDRQAARHHDLFGLNVLPFASAFLEWDGTFGGRVAERSRVWLQSLGLRERSDEPPDHIASHLGALSRAAVMEFRAGSGAERGRAQDASAGLLDELVVPWIPGFTGAVARHGDDFYRNLARHTVELVLSHRSTLGAPFGEPVLSSCFDRLNIESAGLKDISAFLLSAARSGFWLSPADIHGIGRRHELPSGFGTRSRLVINLLRSAATYDRVGPVLKEIDEIAGEFVDWMDDLIAKFEPLAPMLRQTREKIVRSRCLLGDMQHRLDELRSDG